ncbi:MAG: hypothetical protein QN193_08275 [Armatimonadota bacterium]|nr:hypothetical protein [Armatimonadota bacterium]MDR7444200.1 hypothetical protein [Armatimonadota bacterium]MDR7570590.1 hypothetical protein [Armatimonadota bacterium]MDR7614265.1 hypothetical protein [Armatimonadota bacterium]
MRPLWAFHRPVLLVMVHGPTCPACGRLIRELLQRVPAYRVWEGEPVVLHSEPDPFLDLPLSQLRDPAGANRRAYGGREAEAVLACVDARGIYWEGWWLRHPDPVDWREVEETVRWVAVQEPECATCTVEPAWEQALWEDDVG